METAETRNPSSKLYEMEVRDQFDLRSLVEHLPQFMDTADRNDRVMVVEVWMDKKSESTDAF